MSNWNLPTATSGYLDFVTEMNDKFVDAGTLSESPTNQPEKYIRYNRASNIFQEWVAGNWIDKVLGIAGGGTGSTTASGIRTNLGLGSMSTQNSNAVNITGGSISGVNLDAGSITGGIVALARGGTGSPLTIAPNGYVLLSNGSVVYFDTGITISQLNASSLTQGIVPDARLSANVAFKNIDNLFSADQTISKTVSATLRFIDTSQPVDQKRFEITNFGQNLYIHAITDSGTIATTSTLFNRFGDITAGRYVIATAFNGNGAFITNLSGSNIASGIVAPQFLGTGTPNSGNFLRGDGVWSVPSGGSGGGTPIPSGLIAMFDTSCPAGWTRFTQMDNRFPLGSGGAGSVGGSSSHGHNFSGNVDGAGSHSHGFSGSGGLSGARTQGNVTGFSAGFSGGGVQTADAGHSFEVLSPAGHTHGINITIDIPVNGGSVSISGSTDGVGNHSHSYSGATDTRDNTPPYYSLVFCRKD